ncbi:hypothetical protein TVAG_436770 [Trichomonas vaginalis G3]|uniref:Uncharacterized protein n=1 Tax=Trichomonas vaginalis (strain ATCC PRA-98 / G3) TaxID=412133 RepID=A2DFC5_TRIV3|nr:hypothetical protein TVAG_436770 [Trichomonas vaginalis G3]|eukprot:XP_001581839.1 hypothetical protein [Trichomonas vaginalis G3]
MSNGLMVRLVGNRSHSPGPAAYSTRRRPGSESPAWTIKNRYKQKIEAIDAEYVNLESTIGRGPKISMKSRHDSLPKIDTPGPNYIPKNFGSETTPIHVSPRYGDRKTESTPGPGQYTPRDAPSTARVSIRNRTKLPESNVDSPGPAGYSPDYKATRRSSRSPTIGRRASEPKKQITPGPSDYQISRDITNGQGISMHIRPRESGIAVTPGPSDYGSPNNPANFNSPSYTIGHRYDQKTDTNQAGFVNLPSTVGQGPKISMSSRHEARDVEATPGPNYVPPSMAQSARGISIGSRSPDGKIEVTPGPGQYNTLNKSGVDGVTPITIKGRTPLPGAGTDSPGPAGYNPDYDATRKSSPSPTIGRRGIDPKVEVTPGPSDYAISRDITNGQGISMHIRPREGDIAVTPGPSDYGNPNNPSSSNSPSYTIGHRYEQKTDTNQAGFVNLPSTVGQGPKISMSSRHEARDVEPTPGPNYVPPSLAESSRGVTIGHRSPDGKTEITPGPGQYDTLNKSGVDGVTPITIKGRNYMPETSVDSPGPAGYSPDYNSTRRGSPSPTIGRRGIDPKIPVTPGPSDYEISRDITNGGQGISMHIRPREGDIAVTPGPSDYGNPNNPANSNSPSFTIGHRYEQKTDTNQAGFVNLPSTVGQGPKISMSSRHEARDLEPTPGPNYVPPSLAESSRGVTIGSRSPDGKIEVTPGPGQYNTLNKSGVDGVTPITIKGRTPLPGAGTDSPGPAGYNPDYDATRKSSPSPTIGRRGIDPKVEVTPGPSDYAISRDITNGQGISMHIRPREGDIAVTPGPSDYGNPNNPSSSNSPSYTIGHRYEQKTDTNQAGFVNLPSTVGQGPKISMSSRHEARDAEPTPGPNYVPPSLGGKGITIGNRTPDGKTEVTPGPGQYNTLNSSGVDGVAPITIKGRNYLPTTTSESPGPAAYYLMYNPKLDSKGITIGLKYPEKSPESTPGFYDIPSTRGGPAFTIGNREECDVAIL